MVSRCAAVILSACCRINQQHASFHRALGNDGNSWAIAFTHESFRMLNNPHDQRIGDATPGQHPRPME